MLTSNPYRPESARKGGTVGLPLPGVGLRVRDDHGYWSSVEAYIAFHTDAEFTHGICPACVPTVFRPEG